MLLREEDEHDPAFLCIALRGYSIPATEVPNSTPLICFVFFFFKELQKQDVKCSGRVTGQSSGLDVRQKAQKREKADSGLSFDLLWVDES